MVAEMVQKAKKRDKRIKMKVDDTGHMRPVDIVNKKKRGEDEASGYLDMLRSKQAQDIGLRADKDVDSGDDMATHADNARKLLKQNEKKDA